MIAGRNVASQKPISGSSTHVTSLGLIGMVSRQRSDGQRSEVSGDYRIASDAPVDAD